MLERVDDPERHAPGFSRQQRHRIFREGQALLAARNFRGKPRDENRVGPDGELREAVRHAHLRHGAVDPGHGECVAEIQLELFIPVAPEHDDRLAAVGEGERPGVLPVFEGILELFPVKHAHSQVEGCPRRQDPALFIEQPPVFIVVPAADPAGLVDEDLLDAFGEEPDHLAHDFAGLLPKRILPADLFGFRCFVFTFFDRGVAAGFGDPDRFDAVVFGQQVPDCRKPRLELDPRNVGMVRIDIEIGAASGCEDGVEERGEAAVKRHRGDLRFRIGGFDRLVNGLHDPDEVGVAPVPRIRKIRLVPDFPVFDVILIAVHDGGYISMQRFVVARRVGVVIRRVRPGRIPFRRAADEPEDADILRFGFGDDPVGAFPVEPALFRLDQLMRELPAQIFGAELPLHFRELETVDAERRVVALFHRHDGRQRGGARFGSRFSGRRSQGRFAFFGQADPGFVAIGVVELQPVAVDEHGRVVAGEQLRAGAFPVKAVFGGGFADAALPVRADHAVPHAVAGPVFPHAKRSQDIAAESRAALHDRRGAARPLGAVVGFRVTDARFPAAFFGGEIPHLEPPVLKKHGGRRDRAAVRRGEYRVARIFAEGDAVRRRGVADRGRSVPVGRPGEPDVIDAVLLEDARRTDHVPGARLPFRVARDGRGFLRRESGSVGAPGPEDLQRPPVAGEEQRVLPVLRQYRRRVDVQERASGEDRIPGGRFPCIGPVDGGCGKKHHCGCKVSEIHLVSDSCLN